MLARYMLSSRVRLSARLSVTSQYCIKRLDESSWVFWLPSTYPTLSYKEIWLSPKIRVLSSGTLFQTPEWENFARASQSRCQQHSSSSSTVEFVDDAYTTVQCSRKRVQQLKKRKKSCFFEIWKKRKNVKNVGLPPTYSFTSRSITQPLILNYRNRNSVPVPVSHQHHITHLAQKCGHKKLTCSLHVEVWSLNA